MANKRPTPIMKPFWTNSDSDDEDILLRAPKRLRVTKTVDRSAAYDTDSSGDADEHDAGVRNTPKGTLVKLNVGRALDTSSSQTQHEKASSQAETSTRASAVGEALGDPMATSNGDATAVVVQGGGNQIVGDELRVHVGAVSPAARVRRESEQGVRNDGETLFDSTITAMPPPQRPSTPIVEEVVEEAWAATPTPQTPHNVAQRPNSPPRINPVQRQAHITPSTTPSSSTPDKILYTHPQIALRLIPSYPPPTSSLHEPLNYRNPQKFSVQPAFWKRWTAMDYINLSEHMRTQFDPVPFALATGKPVEEVNLIVARLVLNPLYDEAEAKKRGEHAFAQLKERLRKFGSVARPWCDGTLRGRLEGVGPGSVRVVLESEEGVGEGGVVREGKRPKAGEGLRSDAIDTAELVRGSLGLADVQFLLTTLTELDWEVVFGLGKGKYLRRVEEAVRLEEEAKAKASAVGVENAMQTEEVE